MGVLVCLPAMGCLSALGCWFSCLCLDSRLRDKIPVCTGTGACMRVCLDTCACLPGYLCLLPGYVCLSSCMPQHVCMYACASLVQTRCSTVRHGTVLDMNVSLFFLHVFLTLQIGRRSGGGAAVGHARASGRRGCRVYRGALGYEGVDLPPRGGRPLGQVCVYMRVCLFSCSL